MDASQTEVSPGQSAGRSRQTDATMTVTAAPANAAMQAAACQSQGFLRVEVSRDCNALKMDKSAWMIPMTPATPEPGARTVLVCA